MKNKNLEELFTKEGVLQDNQGKKVKASPIGLPTLVFDVRYRANDSKFMEDLKMKILAVTGTGKIFMPSNII